MQSIHEHNALARRHVYSILMAFHDSVISDGMTRALTVKILSRTASLRSHALVRAPVAAVGEAADDAVAGGADAAAAAGDGDAYNDVGDGYYGQGGAGYSDYRAKRGYSDGDGGEDGDVDWDMEDPGYSGGGGYDDGYGGGGGAGAGAGAWQSSTQYGGAGGEVAGEEEDEAVAEDGPGASTPSGALHLWKRVAVLSWLSLQWRGVAATRSLTGAVTPSTRRAAYVAALQVLRDVACGLTRFGAGGSGAASGAVAAAGEAPTTTLALPDGGGGGTTLDAALVPAVVSSCVALMVHAKARRATSAMVTVWPWESTPISRSRPIARDRLSGVMPIWLASPALVMPRRTVASPRSCCLTSNPPGSPIHCLT